MNELLLITSRLFVILIIKMTSTEYIEYFEEDEIKREQSESKQNAKDCVREKEKKINCNQCENNMQKNLI